MSRPTPLTPRQMNCMRVIQDLTDAGAGISPTLDEIASKIGTTKGNVHRLLSLLAERGHIERVTSRARSITILHRLPDPLTVTALLELAKVLAAAVESTDGMVRIIAPKPMIDAAIAAIVAKAA